MPVHHWRATWVSSPSVLQHRVEVETQKKEAVRLLEQRKEALAKKKKENDAKKEAKAAEKHFLCALQACAGQVLVGWL